MRSAQPGVASRASLPFAPDASGQPIDASDTVGQRYPSAVGCRQTYGRGRLVRVVSRRVSEDVRPRLVVRVGFRRVSEDVRPPWVVWVVFRRMSADVRLEGSNRPTELTEPAGRPVVLP